MKNNYIPPELIAVSICPTLVLCLSLTGGTEGMDSSDLPDIPIDNPLDW